LHPKIVLKWVCWNVLRGGREKKLQIQTLPEVIMFGCSLIWQEEDPESLVHSGGGCKKTGRPGVRITRKKGTRMTWAKWGNLGAKHRVGEQKEEKGSKSGDSGA